MTTDYCILTFENSQDDRVSVLPGLSPSSIVNVDVHEIRQLGIRNAMRRLAGFADHQVLLRHGEMETNNGRLILLVAALLTTSRNVRRLEADGTETPVLRREMLAALFGLVGTSLINLLCTLRALAVLTVLSHLKPLRVDDGGDGPVLYIFAGTWFGPKTGGAIAHMSGMLNAFARNGLSVIFPGYWHPPMLAEDVRTVKLADKQIFGLPAEAVVYRTQLRFGAAVRRVLRETKPRFVYQRLTLGGFAGVLISRALKVPLVLEYNGSEVWIARNWGGGLRFDSLAEKAEIVCLKHADLVITVSRVLAEDLQKKGVEKKRVLWRPNGVDSERFDPECFDSAAKSMFRRHLGIPSNACVVGFVGTFGRWHGTDVLAKAIRRLACEDRSWLIENRVRFLVAGKGDYFASFEKTISAEGVTDFVDMLGIVPQHKMPLLLASCDVLVSPHVANDDRSRFFGSPVKLFEYMATGRMIVASDLDQLSEVMSGSPHVGNLMRKQGTGTITFPNDAPGLIFTPGDDAELTMALKLACENEDWRRRAGACGRGRAVELYTWDAHVRAVIEGLSMLRSDR